MDEPKKNKGGRPKGSYSPNRLTKEKRDKWDILWGKEYVKADCEAMDKAFAARASDFKGGLTQRVELALRDWAKMRLARDKAMAAGDAAEATRCQNIMNSIDAGESLKANDAKPLESVRVDAIVTALEKKGAIENNKLISKADLIKLLRDDKHPYHTSVDVVDEIIFLIINTMRRNNGQGELTSLPVSAQVQDIKGELLDKMTDEEVEAMQYFGIAPPPRDNAER